MTGGLFNQIFVEVLEFVFAQGRPVHAKYTKERFGRSSGHGYWFKAKSQAAKFEIDHLKILEIRKFNEKSTFPGPNWRLKIQNRFADAKSTSYDS